MAWQDSAQPDDAPVAGWQASAQPDEDTPVAPAAPVLTMGNARNANLGIAPSMSPAGVAAPSVPANEESTFAPTDTPPGVAAPEASARYAAGMSPQMDQQDLAAMTHAQAAIAARKVASVKAALGGADFDPSNGINSAWERARLGLMANSVDRAKYLQDNLPAGSDVKIIKPAGIGPMVVFKPPGATAYQPIKGVNDVAGKIGDVLSATPAVATQVGTAVATDGSTLLPRLFTQFLAGATERGGELATNAAGGYDSQNGLSDAADMARSGAAADAGELGGAALSYAGRTGAAATGGALSKMGATGAAKPFQDIGSTIPGMMTPTSEGLEALAAEARLRDANPDLTPLAFDQLGHPFAQAKGQRLRAISPVLPNISNQQRSTIADMLSNASTVNGAKPAITDAGTGAYPGLSDVTSAMKTEAAAPLAGIPEVEPVEGGRALASIYQKSIAPVMNRVSDKYGNVLDKMANAPGQPNGVVPLDLTGAHAAIDKEAAPVFGQGVPQEVQTETPIMGTGGLGEPKQLGTQTATEVVPTEVKTGGGISPALQQPVSALRALNPTNGVGPMTDRTASPYEAVKPILSQLSEKSVYNPLAPGADRAPSNQASAIVAPLSEAVDAAAGPASSAAKNSRAFANAILDNPQAIAVRETPYPEQNMRMATPDNTSFLTNTQRLANATGQGPLYKTFQDAVATGLARQPEKIDALTAAGAASPNTMNRLLTPDVQGKVAEYGANMKAFNNSLAAKVAAEPDFVKRAMLIADSGDLQGASALINKAGGIGSPMAENTRGAIYHKLLNDSLDEESGKVDMGKLAKNAGRIADDDGAAGVFPPDQLQQMKDIQTYANAANSAGNGMGSSIMASELAGRWNLARPDKWPGLLAALLEAKIQGSLYTADRAGVIGKGLPTGLLPRAVGTGGAAYEQNQKRQEPTVGR